jgi:hypothetical protein
VDVLTQVDVLKGHGFSRAANVIQAIWALAPEGMQGQKRT